jgi:hypothetical protein
MSSFGGYQTSNDAPIGGYQTSYDPPPVAQTSD